MNTANDHWHILGAGAIGSLWASYAYQHGRPATLLLRNDERLRDYQRAQGLLVTLGAGAELLPLPAESCEQPGAAIQHLLLTTKAPDSHAAVSAISPRLAQGATVVLLQNGLGVREELLALRPDLQCYHAVTTEGAYRPAPFQLVHAGRGHSLLGGGPAAQTLAASLSVGPLQVAATDDIDSALWRKLAINCAINPLTALYRCRNGELLDNPLALQQLHSVVDEIVELGRRMGKAERFDGLREQVLAVVSGTALNRSSMLQDIEAGRHSEIDYITGYLCRQAEHYGCPADTNRQLLAQIQALPSTGGVS